MNEYNWHNLEVGRFDLNHSENFFAFKHSKHEKFLIKSEISETLMEEQDAKENCSGILNEQPSQDPLDYEKGSIITSKRPNKNITEKKKESPKLVKLDTKKPHNILTEQQSHKRIVNVPTQSKQKIPNAVKYVEIYERKKLIILRKQKEDERKKRIFHSRPAPNFSASHENAYNKRQEERVITCPITPRALKHSTKANNKIKKLEKSPIKHFAKEPKVLNETPFKPKKESRVVEIQPFNLHVEKRLCDRRNFDEKIQKQMEAKKRKEEEDRIKRDEELSREFRKMTTFKARPNPFK